MIASLAIAGYAFLQIVDRPNALNTMLWFGGAIVAHDLLAFPIYSAFGVLAGRATGASGAARPPSRVAALNHVRVPLLLSAFAFVAWFPLILGLSEEKYTEKTGLTESVFLGRWLLLTAALTVGSGMIYAIRLRRSLER